MAVAPDQQIRIQTWVKNFLGIDIGGGQAMAKPAGTTLRPDEIEDTVALQSEIEDGLHHLEASIATMKAANLRTRKFEAGYQTVVKARDAALKKLVAGPRAKALGTVFAMLNTKVVEAQDALNAGARSGNGGPGGLDRLTEGIEADFRALDTAVASMKALRADTAKLEAARKTLADTRDGTRQIQDDGARAEALGKLAQRLSATVADAKTQLAAAGNAKPAVTDEQVAAIDRGIGDLLTMLRGLIATAAKAGLNVKQMQTEQPELDKARAAANALEGNPAKARALSALQARLNGEVRHARSLTDAIDAVMGKEKGAPTEEQKSKIYESALLTGYNLKVEVPPGMKNTHFDQVFDMLGTVPPSHAMQPRLKRLKYDKQVKGGEYDEKTNGIAMGDLGDGTETEDYRIGDKKIKANSFNVTTLHEIGHSVDTKLGVMKSHMAKTGCGGWEAIPPAKLVPTLAGLMRRHLGIGRHVHDDVLAGAIAETLKSNDNKPYPGIPEKDWDNIGPWLWNFIVQAREAKNPWNGTRESIGGRVYHEAYKDLWYSYDAGARPATEVSKYQWRSPDEWFAEVYAISWLSKKPPPGGVDAAVAQHMFKSA